MSLREKIENNLALVLLTALSTGFVAGLGAYKAVLEIAQLEVVSKAKLESLQSVAAKDVVEGEGGGRELSETSTGGSVDAASTPNLFSITPAKLPSSDDEAPPKKPRVSLAQAKPPSMKIRVSGWIDSENTPRETLTDKVVDHNFTLPVERKITNFRLTITQVVDGEACAEANISPGALGFPAGTLMDSKPEFKERFEAGCQVTTAGTVIQCFVDPKKAELCG